MPDDRVARLVGRFAAAARAHNAALEAFDEERTDAHARIIAGLYAALVREGKSGREGLLALIDDSDPAVAGMAAVYSLSYYSQPCLEVLRRLAAEGGFLGFRASVVLERWEAGEWEGP
jgi:hypothetical protein